jgi:hypothetical protein
VKLRERRGVETAAEPDALDAVTAHVVFEADDRVFVGSTDHVGGEYVRARPDVAVREAHVADADAVAWRDLDGAVEVVRDRGGVAVVIAVDERDREMVRERVEQRSQLLALVATGIADRVAEVAEKDQPVGGLAVEYRQERPQTLLGVTGEFDAVAAEAGLDAGVVVGDDDGALVAEIRDGGRFAGDRLDAHQIGL